MTTPGGIRGVVGGMPVTSDGEATSRIQQKRPRILNHKRARCLGPVVTTSTSLARRYLSWRHSAWRH